MMWRGGWGFGGYEYENQGGGGAGVEAEAEGGEAAAGVVYGEFSDYAARTARDTVVRNAQPFGTGKKAREKGEKAIAGIC